MSWAEKSHKRKKNSKEFVDPKVNATRTDCQAAGDGITEQAHKDEVSIQNIVKRAQRGEAIDMVNNANWGVDTLGQPGFDEAQNIIANTKAMFEQLPSNIRTMCGNNPGNFLEFYEDEANRHFLEEAGLDTSHLPAEPPAAEPPVEPPAAAPVPAPAGP